MKRDVEALPSRNDRVFLGILDDSVSRHPWSGSDASLATLNEALLFHALFGAPVCARAGNILYHPAYFQALRSRQISPLRALLRVGFFQLHLRGTSINDSIALRRAEGTDSAKYFIESNQWSPASDLSAELTRIENEVRDRGLVQYPLEFRRFSHHLMDQAIRFETDEWLIEIYARWSNEEPNLRTRTRFENLALQHCSEDPERLRKAMWFANAVDHYAYATAMAAKSPTVGMWVETCDLASLRDACCSVPESTEALDELEQVERSELIERHLYNLELPLQLVDHAATWDGLASLLDEDNQSLKAIQFREAKGNLRQAVADMLMSPFRNSEPELDAAVKRFNAALAHGLGLSTPRMIINSLRVYCRALHTRTSKSYVPPAVKAAGVALSAAAGGALAGSGGGAVGVVVGGYLLKHSAEELANHLVPPVRRLVRSLVSVDRLTPAGSEAVIRSFGSTLAQRQIRLEKAIAISKMSNR